jgi:ComF family protein
MQFFLEAIHSWSKKFLALCARVIFRERDGEKLLGILTELPPSTQPVPYIITHKPFPIYSLGKYDTKLWHALIYEIKFHKNKHAISLLAPAVRKALTALSENVRSLASYNSALPLMLPIPLYPARERARGFNQVSVVLHAALKNTPLAEHLNEHILARTIQREQQKTLHREAREKNISGSFEVLPHMRDTLRSRHIILVDDVCATGSTVREAAHTLMHAGAASVTIFVFCNS